MAYRLFDQRVVNPLERPVSEDPNAGFSQDSGTLRTVLGQLYTLPTGVGVTARDGFIDNGFKPIPSIFGPGLEVTLSQGMGLKAISQEQKLSIGGVAGVDDMSSYKPLVLRSPKTLTVPAPPLAGFARRDFIAVRWTPHLGDSVPSRVFNAGTQSFSLQAKFKTMSWDLYDYEPAYLPAGGSTSTSITDPIIYVPGVASAYDSGDLDSILTCPLPSVPTDYAIVAVVNVVGGVTEITATDIVDYRRRVFSGGMASLYAKPLIGAAEFLGIWLAGQVIDLAAVYTPNQVTAFLSRIPTTLPPSPITAFNDYELAVIGCRDVSTITGQLLPVLDPAIQYQPISAAVVSQVISGIATKTEIARWQNSALTPEGTDVAIGQPYSAIRFRIGVTRQVSGSAELNQFEARNTTWDTEGLDIRTIRILLQATLLT